MLSRFKSLKVKPSPKPIYLQQADEASSDAFFNALLKSCSTPTILTRTSFSGYESTPEPLGHPQPPGLHRHATTKAFPIVPESKYYRTSDGLERELLKPLQAADPAQWPTRTSSIKGSQRYANKYKALIEEKKQPGKAYGRKHPPSSIASVETSEDPFIEDGYDHYSEQRHDVLRNRGFWPRLKRDDSEPFQRTRVEGEMRRPVQDYDRSPPPLKREDAILESLYHHDNSRGLISAAKPENSFNLRRSILFEPPSTSHPAPQPIVPSISDLLAATPSTIGLVPQPLFSKVQPPSRGSHSDSGSDRGSQYSLPFEGTSIFSLRGGSEEPVTPLSPWAHTHNAERPCFQDVKLEEYRLADPALLQNIGQPIPETPYLHLSWKTLSHEEFLIALGHYALSQGLELPLIYAARPNFGRDWAQEESFRRELEKFNGRVEEMCKVELATIERMNKRAGFSTASLTQSSSAF